MLANILTEIPLVPLNDYASATRIVIHIESLDQGYSRAPSCGQHMYRGNRIKFVHLKVQSFLLLRHSRFFGRPGCAMRLWSAVKVNSNDNLP